jgi:O-antigen ligase
MYQEKRPTCVTVIGWAWIVVAILMCLSAVMALFASSMMLSQISSEQPDAAKNIPTFFRFFPLLAVMQLCVAIFGIISGINFLKLKAWSRTALEILTWLTLLFVIGFMIFWVASWLFGTTSSHAPIGFSITDQSAA